jgi:glycosyltransferase involved in cell wall biosynthesis
MSNETSYKRLTAIVPVYDERNTVGEVVRRLRSLALPDHLELEILVVDDGSTDGTDKVLKTIEDSTVRVVTHKTNQGKGAAIRTGLAEARGDIILLQDADLEYSPEDVPKLLDPILSGRAKVVFGSRFHPSREAMPLTSLIGDRALSVAACVLFNTTTTDIETGLRAFDKATIDSFELTQDRHEVEIELAAKTLRSGHRIFEVPVSYERRAPKRPGSKSRVNGLKVLVSQRFRG